jgi:hypothetical protein
MCRLQRFSLRPEVCSRVRKEVVEREKEEGGRKYSSHEEVSCSGFISVSPYSGWRKAKLTISSKDGTS